MSSLLFSAMPTFFQYFIGLAVGALLTFIIWHIIPQEKVRKINQEIEKQEQELREEIGRLEHQRVTALQNIEIQKLEEQNAINDLQHTYSLLEEKIKSGEENADQQIKNYYLEEYNKIQDKLFKDKEDYQKTIDSLIEQLEKKSQEEQLNYEAQEQDYINSYKEIVSEYLQNFQTLQDKIVIQESILKNLKSQVDAATAVNERNYQDSQEKEFYKLKLSIEDIDEIKKIRSIEPYLRNKDVLNKVIWTSYYRTPTGDLCNRVVGVDKKTGIYKITNINNGMIYIGQAVNIGR